MGRIKKSQEPLHDIFSSVAKEYDPSLIRDESFPEQDAFVNDKAQFLAAICTRRAGKTNALALRFLRTMREYPGSLSRYIALTRESAKDIMWPVLQEMDERFGLESKFTDHDLTMTLPNGAKLRLLGADLKNFIRRLKGAKSPAVAIDECFHPNTLVQAINGEIPISQVKQGMLVVGARGYQKVLKVSKKAVDSRRILRYNGREIICSDNHPFFTYRGWVQAKDIRTGECLVSTELSMRIMQKRISETHGASVPFLLAALLGEEFGYEPGILEGEAQGQPDVQKGDQREGLKDSQGDGTQASDQGWQWPWSYRTRKDNSEPTDRLKVESRRWARPSWEWLSYKLQSRFGMGELEASDRGRWPFSHPILKEGSGQKKRRATGFIRVESNESYKFRSDEKPDECLFYDLTMEKHPSFTVNDALVHNCQDFGEHITSLVDDVLTPTLADYPNSWLALTGTPGPVPRGMFYEITEKKSASYAVHKWSLYQNPYLPNAQDFVNKLKERKKWDENNPTYLREWQGRWVLDLQSLLVRYSQFLNSFAHLPSGHTWEYIMGIDIGHKDADALAILAHAPTSPNIYLVYETITRGQDITELSKQIESMIKLFNPYKIVMDTGGLGLKVAEEIRRRKHLPIQAADKKRKFENVALLNDYLRQGKFFAKHDSRFAQDSYQLQIDHEKTTPDRLVVKSGFHSDVIDAVLYAFRESPAFAYQEPPLAKPKWGTKEWSENEVTDMERAAEEHFKQESDEFMNGY